MRTSQLLKQLKNGDVIWQSCYGREAIILDNCALYFVPKGTAGQIKGQKKSKLRLVDEYKKKSIDSEYMTEAHLTGEKKALSNGTVAVEISDGQDSKWVDERLIAPFGAKAKYHFDISGWEDNIVFVSEKDILVGAVCKIREKGKEA